MILDISNGNVICKKDRWNEFLRRSLWWAKQISTGNRDNLCTYFEIPPSWGKIAEIFVVIWGLSWEKASVWRHLSKIAIKNSFISAVYPFWEKIGPFFTVISSNFTKTQAVGSPPHPQKALKSPRGWFKGFYCVIFNCPRTRRPRPALLEIGVACEHVFVGLSSLLLQVDDDAVID